MEPPPASVFDTWPEIPHPEAYPTALNLLKDLHTNSTIPWTSNGEKSGITIESYQPNPPLPAPITRGTGFFPAGLTAEQILPVIHQHACRKHWDDRFQTGFPTLRFSRKLVRFYAVQKGVGGGWFSVVSPRDFTGYSGHAKEIGEDGVTRYYYLQTSAEFDDVPPVEGCVRGETSIAGWILEEKEGEPVKCSYIIKFDPKGSIPHTILMGVALNAPVCIARVSDYIKKNGLVPYVRMHDDFPGQLRQEVLGFTETEINPENGEELSSGGAKFMFSWFGAPGSFDINFDEKSWTNGVKIDVEEGTVGEDLEFTNGEGKVTILVKDAGNGKKLKVVVSKA
ncbi:hypothetical protein ABW19_dt0200703 [Dactylella cylindrospora]|nr:hypothetical protein ABW19_dt0200703 [Dactylella cylindrospora]